ncbi:MAG: GPW/gp25 family protein [Chitinophagales bacterium]|nr:GPW/gp25 family protein [Chitinophagales bacterium]
MVDLAYLGKAVKYPLTITNGAVAVATGTDVIYGSILMILTTPIGTAYFNPEFGSNIFLVFHPNDEVLARQLKDAVYDSLGKWEKRIRVIDVRVDQGLDAALVYIRYKILATDQVDTFVYPYFKKRVA